MRQRSVTRPSVSSHQSSSVPSSRSPRLSSHPSSQHLSLLSSSRHQPSCQLSTRGSITSSTSLRSIRSSSSSSTSHRHMKHGKTHQHGRKTYTTSLSPSNTNDMDITTRSNTQFTPSRKDMYNQETDVTIAHEFLQFNTNAVTEFHCTYEAVKLLKDAGYTQLREGDQWDLQKGGKYFLTRNQAAVVAFAVGEQWAPGNGFIISGAHTDSPVLKLKPISKVNAAGFLQVGIQTYGGGLWNTWFDRDLSVAGRIFVRQPDGKSIKSQLVKVDEPIMRIPNLAIHLNRTVNTDGFKINTEDHLVPIIATQLADESFGSSGVNANPTVFPKKDDNTSSSKQDDKGCAHTTTTTGLDRMQHTFALKHHGAFISRIAHAAGVNVADIVDFELALFDTQAPQLTGLYKEFICARGLDNQLMSFICTKSLIAATTPEHLAKQSQVCVVGLFNHEEIGSLSSTGADSSLMKQVLERIDPTHTPQAISRSLLISADMAHAIHPNYQGKHEANHKPQMHQGLVVKTNANQRYATDANSTCALLLAAADLSIPLQDFCVRNDVGCGSTIGAILSANCGVRVVDVGVPQWSMHSVRETCGVRDVTMSFELIKHMYINFADYDQRIVVDGDY